jgi:hypothetical protein
MAGLARAHADIGWRYTGGFGADGGKLLSDEEAVTPIFMAGLARAHADIGMALYWRNHDYDRNKQANMAASLKKSRCSRPNRIQQRRFAQVPTTQCYIAVTFGRGQT